MLDGLSSMTDVPDPISADSLFSDEFSDCFCTDVTEAYTYESVLLTSLTVYISELVSFTVLFILFLFPQPATRSTADT